MRNPAHLLPQGIVDEHFGRAEVHADQVSDLPVVTKQAEQLVRCLGVVIVSHNAAEERIAGAGVGHERRVAHPEEIGGDAGESNSRSS